MKARDIFGNFGRTGHFWHRHWKRKNWLLRWYRQNYQWDFYGTFSWSSIRVENRLEGNQIIFRSDSVFILL